jgi:hypothetical protein
MDANREAELRLCAAAESGDVYETMRLLGLGVAIDCTNEVSSPCSTVQQASDDFALVWKGV